MGDYLITSKLTGASKGDKKQVRENGDRRAQIAKISRELTTPLHLQGQTKTVLLRRRKRWRGFDHGVSEEKWYLL